MIKHLLRATAESLGYSIRRRAPPPAPAPLPSPALQPVRVDLFPGWPVELALGDAIQRHALAAGSEYEAPTPQLLRTFCGPPGTVFFDIGANFGFYSYYLLANCPQLTAYSFEPNPRHLAGHRAVAERLAAGRYFPMHAGLGDEDGELSLTVSSLDSGWSTLGRNPSFEGISGTLTTHRVPVMRFDDWRSAQGLALPDQPSWVAKIDVEGFEPRVLQGMSAALEAQAFKALVVEVLDHTLHFCGTTADEVFTRMDRAGYAPFDLWLQPTRRLPQEARNVLFLPRA